MKWKALAACAVVALSAVASAYAQQPTLTSRRAVMPAPQVRQPIFSPISWWAKYGQPLEAPPEAAAAADAAEPDAVHDHGYGFGYVYGPGACDYRPPCIDQLWDGYAQRPWRCSHPVYKNHGGCGACGAYGACGSVSDGGYGGGHSCAAAPSCGVAAACGCDDMPTCNKCKPCKQRLAHWSWNRKCCDSCDSCSAGLSCGCAAPAGPGIPAADAHAAPPVPAADEASFRKAPLMRRVSVAPVLER